MKNNKFLLTFKLISWVGLVVLFFFVSVAAVDMRNNTRCSEINIKFKNDKNLGFLHAKDVIKEVNDANPDWEGQSVSKIKFNLIENSVKQNEYVKRAELYLDYQNKINVLVEPKSPIARLHTDYGSYYLSENWDKMSLSNKYTQRIVHISGRVNRLLDPKTTLDSFIKISVEKILNYINENKIWRDAVEQIYVRENGKIELVLSFCKPIIVMGYIDSNFEKRMNKLERFIRTVSRHHNLSDYSELNLEYSQQVVAKKTQNF